MRPTYPRPSRLVSPLTRDAIHLIVRIVDRYLFKPCDASWKDGIIALEAGERKYPITPPRATVELPSFLSSCAPAGSGIGTLHQLLGRDDTLFGKLTAHEVYSLIQ